VWRSFEGFSARKVALVVPMESTETRSLCGGEIARLDLVDAEIVESTLWNRRRGWVQMQKQNLPRDGCCGDDAAINKVINQSIRVAVAGDDRVVWGRM